MASPVHQKHTDLEVELLPVKKGTTPDAKKVSNVAQPALASTTLSSNTSEKRPRFTPKDINNLNNIINKEQDPYYILRFNFYIENPDQLDYKVCNPLNFNEKEDLRNYKARLLQLKKTLDPEKTIDEDSYSEQKKTDLDSSAKRSAAISINMELRTPSKPESGGICVLQ